MSTDRELAARFADGEEAAFRTLYRDHSPALFAFIRRILGRRSEQAEDVLQDVWMRAVRDLGRFAWQSAFRTWLFGIALNRCREVIRLTTRIQAEDVELDTDFAAEPAFRPGERVDLERALAALSLRYREVLVLHDIHQYTHEEIGGLLGIDAGTSKSNLARGRRAMRALMTRTGANQEQR
jgi:RNA polymerase sigma-70 factor (ECF subfamily)